MALTLAQVDTMIQSLLESPQVDYTIGDKSVSASQKLAQLRAYRKDLIEQPTSEIAFVNFPMDFDEFGEPEGEVQD